MGRRMSISKLRQVLIMTTRNFSYTAQTVPEGYFAVALSGGASEGVLRIAVLAKDQADPPGGHFVLLRRGLAHIVYLGCVLDAADRVQQWVELWIQSVAEVGGLVDLRDELTNAQLDRRWAQQAGAVGALGQDGYLSTGWETRHPPPLFIDVDARGLCDPAPAGEGSTWRLCEDDALLAAHGLPAYSGSRHRYLCSEPAGREPVFVAVSPDAPTPDGVSALQSLLSRTPRIAPLNPEGGLMLVRPHDPLALEDFIDLLGGKPWEGLYHGRATVDPARVGAQTDAHACPGWMYLASRGLSGRLQEILHLKLCALSAVFECVQAHVRHTQAPVLNISADSFRVRLPPSSDVLPFLWGATVSLADPGVAIPMAIPGADRRCFLRPGGGDPSIYRPGSTGAPGRGSGTFRIRKILSESRKATIVEGTLSARERIPVGTTDLVRLRVSLGDAAVDLFGHMEEDRALAAGELRFRSLAHVRDEAGQQRLRSAEGVPIQNTLYETIPALGSTCDLYSLAVLGVRMLLVNADTTLAVALDELLSLAREAGSAAAGAGLPVSIARLLAASGRWVEALGPQRLLMQACAPGDALACVPAAVWSDVLAMLIRMLPGASKFSSYPDYGESAAGALHTVFDHAIRDVRKLVALTRELIVTDWRSHREIAQLVDTMLLREARSP